MASSTIECARCNARFVADSTGDKQEEQSASSGADNGVLIGLVPDTEGAGRGSPARNRRTSHSAIPSSGYCPQLPAGSPS